MFKGEFSFLILLAMILVGCGTPTNSGQTSGDNSNNQNSGTSMVNPVTPVYQGMVISSTAGTQSRHKKSSGATIDQDNPFGNPNGYLIEDFINADMPMVSTAPLAYYADVNEEVIVTVRVYNPSSFEILSFTLNTYKYQSYQFEDGSDSENLLLKTSVGMMPGIKEYTIDQIKYVDGVDIKDVLIEGNQTVAVGIRYPSDPTIDVSNIVVTKSAYTFDITLLDPNQILGNEGSETRAYVFDGVSLIKNIVVNATTSGIVFDGLLSDTLYQYALVGIFDNLSGAGLQRTYFQRFAFTTDSYIAITNVIPTQNSVAFGITEEDPDNVGVITSIELFKGATLIESLSNLNLREFLGLLSYNDYEIRVTFTYNLGDENGEQTNVAIAAFTTVAKAIPTVLINNVVPTQTSVTFALTVTDVDDVGSLTSIQLMEGDNVLATLMDLGTRQFVSLLSNATYAIKTVYTYDLNDGLGTRTVISESPFATLSKTTPVLAIEGIVSTQTSIHFGITVSDPDGVIDVTSIMLYSGAVLVSSLTELELREFTGLTSNTGYSIHVAYNYDLNDGIGEQAGLVTQTVVTLAQEISITGISVLNTTNPKVGEEVHVRIYLNNPDSIVITAFIINGQEISVVGGSVITSAIVKFVPDFAGGIYDVTIDAIQYLSHGITLEQNILSVYSDSILVLGDLAVIDITTFDGHDYINTSDIASEYLVIEIANPTGYDISQLLINYSNMNTYTYSAGEITMPDANHVKVLWHGSNWCDQGYNSETVAVTSITYGIVGEEYSTKLLSGITKRFALLKSDVVHMISTPTELANMVGGYINKLQNDIDLISTPWTPITSFYGILDGDGHSIKNLTMVVENVSSNPQSFGFFDNLTGKVSNVSFQDAYISIKTPGAVSVGTIAGIVNNNGSIDDVAISGTSISIDSNGALVGVVASNLWGTISNCRISASSIEVASTASVNAGGVAGSAWGYIDDCSVDGLTLNIETAGTYLEVAVGGIIGHDEYGISGCAVDNTMITVIVSSGLIDVGGIAGYGNSISHCSVRRTSLTASMTKSILMGGISAVMGSNAVIADCLVYGLTMSAVSEGTMAHAQVGGITSSMGTISRCLVTGASIHVTSTNFAGIYGIAASGPSSTITDSYIGFDLSATFNDTALTLTDPVATLEQLNTKSFYTTSLKWEETVWNLDHLDYENGFGPVLIFEA